MRSILAFLAICLPLKACFNAPQSAYVTIAVAANFSATAKDIGRAFTTETGIETRFSFASTGKLYTQIEHGAPFDVFLAADARRPTLCIEAGLCTPDTQFTYATGQLVLWSAASKPEMNDAAVLGDFNQLAIANPNTAPYGVAALETLDAQAADLGERLIQADSVTQAFQFVATGAAELGFIALSQVQAQADTSNYWLVPQELYTPLTQDAVLTRRGEANPAAASFLAFLKRPDIQQQIQQHGYKTP